MMLCDNSNKSRATVNGVTSGRKKKRDTLFLRSLTEMAKLNASRTRRTPAASGVRRAIRTRNVSPESATALSPPPRLCIPAEPPKVPRRPPSKGSKRETLADIAKRIPIQVMRSYFNYPLRTAAQAMNISVTTLKRLCRRQGVKRWPHRQICGINRALSDLETQHQLATGTDAVAIAKQLRELHRRRDIIIELAFESDEESGRMRFGLDSTTTSVVAHKRISANNSRLSTNGTSSPPRRSTAAGENARAAASVVEARPASPASTALLSDDDGKLTLSWWYPTSVDDIESVSSGDIDTAIGGDGGDGITVYPRRPQSSGSSAATGLELSSRRAHFFNPLPEFALPMEVGADGERGPSSRANSGGGSAVGMDDADQFLSLSGGGSAAACHQSIHSIEQHMNELAAEGDLLFGADEMAADNDGSIDSACDDVSAIHGVLASGAGGGVHHNYTKSSAWAYHLFGLPISPGLYAHDPQPSLSKATGGATSGGASSGGEPATFSTQDHAFPAGGGGSCVSASPWAGATSGWGTWGPSSSVN